MTKVKVKITGEINAGYKIEVDGKDISEFCDYVNLSIRPNEMPRLEILFASDEIDIDIDNIEYFMEQKDIFKMKINALGRVTK